MTDVFLSYKAEDRPRLQPLVAALQADGVSVWWDAHIGGGDDWRDAIQQNLDSAKCVIVAWSKRSVAPEGKFVRDEASRAQRRGVYLPIRIDDVELPLGFGEVQALPLTGWKGSHSDPRYQALLNAISSVTSGERSIAHAPLAAPRVSRRAALAGGGVIALGAAGVGGWWLFGPGSSAEASVAVMPFANLSGDPAQAYFADGIAEELRGALGRISGLTVIGRTSSEKMREADATEAARKLNVANVLTGSVRRAPGLLRVSAQLVDGSNGVERWSESYDRPEGNALQIQTGIAEAVAGALSIRLGAADKAALALGGTKVANAHELYLKAVAARVPASEAALRRAIALTDSAIAADAKYAEAHALRARLLANLAGSFQTSAAEGAAGIAEAVTVARHAISLAPKLWEGHAVLGAILSFQLDFAGSLDAYAQARALGADEPGFMRSFSYNLAKLGRSSESVPLATRAVALDPLNPIMYLAQQMSLFYARRYDEAIVAGGRTLALAPGLEEALSGNGWCMSLQGKPREALAEYAKIEDADAWQRLTGEAIAHAQLGDRPASDKAVARLVELNGDTVHFQVADIRAQRGEADQAFAALDAALTARDPGLSSLPADPFLDPVRGDPRFQALVRQLKFP